MRIPASEPVSRGDRIPSGRNATPKGGTLLNATPSGAATSVEPTIKHIERSTACRTTLQARPHHRAKRALRTRRRDLSSGRRGVGRDRRGTDAGRAPQPHQRPGGGSSIELSCDGRSVPPAIAGRPDPATSCGNQPFDAYSLAVACGDRGVSRRTPSRQPFGTPAIIVRRPVRGHDLGSLRGQRARPRATACCQLHARRNRQAGAVSPRCSTVAVEDTPPFARDRDVAPGALAVASTALPRDCGEARPAPSGAATDARHSVRRRP